MQAMGIRLDQTPQADASARWLQPPRLRTLAEEGERHASWLELFFDLVFVVAITELSHYLVTDHSAGGFLRFAALFVPVYVAWQGYTAYASRSARSSVSKRLAYAVYPCHATYTGMKSAAKRRKPPAEWSVTR